MGMPQVWTENGRTAFTGPRTSPASPRNSNSKVSIHIPMVVRTREPKTATEGP